MWYLKINDDKMNLVGKNGELYHGFREESVVLPTGGVALTLKANYYQGGYWILDKPKRLYNIYGDDKGTGYAGNVWDKNEISPTLETMQGGNRQPMVEVYPCLTPGRQEKRQNGPRFRGENEEMFTLTSQDIHGVMVIDDYNQTIRKDNDTIGTITTNIGNKAKRTGFKIAEPNTCLVQPVDRDYNKKGEERKVHIETKDDGVSHTLRTNAETMVNENKMQGLRIRKLTPKECWRLMGWDDESFEKAEKVNSNSQLYKQAGNGIVINCMAALIKQML